MLTGRGITLLLGALLAWIAGRTFGIGELYAVSVASLAAVALGVLYVRQTTSAVSARRLLAADRVIAGGTIDGRLELRNDARVPSPTLLVEEVLPDSMWADDQDEPGTARFVLSGLGPHRIAAAAYHADASTRGRYELGPVTVRVRDPFGVAERTRRYTTTAPVTIYPRIEPLTTHQVRGSHMGTGSSDSRRVFATGEEFFGMREYVRGDDLRMIHWPSTAHRQELMVRQMEQPWQAQATVYLDARAKVHTPGAEGTLERAVSIAASLTYHLADRNYAIRLVTDSDTGRGGPQPWEETLETLAVLSPSGHSALAPSVAATRGGEGLLAAALGVPAGRDALGSHPDLRALMGVRGFGQRIAFIVADGTDRAHLRRAEQAAAVLASNGWQATAITAGQPLAEPWEQLMRPTGHHATSAMPNS